MKLGLGEKIRELRLKEGKTQEALLDGAEHSYTAPLVKFVKTRSGSPADIAKTLPEDWPSGLYLLIHRSQRNQSDPMASLGQRLQH